MYLPHHMIKKLPYLIEQATNFEGVKSSRHVAAIFSKRTIISLGFNSYKSHPMMNVWGTNSKSIYIHAEIDAIRKVRWVDLTKCDMLVIRLNKKNELASSKPCEGCARAIIAFGLKDVYWT